MTDVSCWKFCFNCQESDFKMRFYTLFWFVDGIGCLSAKVGKAERVKYRCYFYFKQFTITVLCLLWRWSSWSKTFLRFFKNPHVTNFYKFTIMLPITEIKPIHWCIFSKVKYIIKRWTKIVMPLVILFHWTMFFLLF